MENNYLFNMTLWLADRFSLRLCRLQLAHDESFHGAFGSSRSFCVLDNVHPTFTSQTCSPQIYMSFQIYQNRYGLPVPKIYRLADKNSFTSIYLFTCFLDEFDTNRFEPPNEKLWFIHASDGRRGLKQLAENTSHLLVCTANRGSAKSLMLFDDVCNI